MGRISHHLTGKDYKKTRQRQLDEQRILHLEKREKEIQEQEDKEFLEYFKSNWRNTLTESEWYAISGSGPTNSASQTFAYGSPDSGIETTVSGIGGLEQLPSSVTINGEVYDAPTYNQLAMQGYAPLMQMQRRTDLQDVNSRLDASQEFAQNIGADYMMNARVDGDYYNSPEYKEYEKELERVNAENDRRYAERDKKLDDFLKSFGVSADELINNRYAFIKDGKAYTFEGDRSDGVLYVHKQVSNASGPLEFSIKPGEKNNQGIYFKLENSEVEIKKSFKVNLLPLPSAPPYPSPKPVFDISKLEKDYGEIASTDLIKDLILHSNPQTAIIPIATHVAKVLNIPAQWMLKLVAGDYTPITKSPGEFHNKQVFDIIRAKYKMLDIGATTSKEAPKGAIPDDIYNRGMPSDYLTNFNMAAVRGSLGQFNYEVTPIGLKIKDTFNFGTNLNVGFLSDIPGTQQAANALVAVSDQVARMKGLNPRDDKFGIPINYTIPWSQVPADLQNRLDPYQRIVPIRKKRQNESTTWNRLKKNLKGA